MSTYKLVYFNVKGLAENIRILFFLAGQKYEDERYPFDTSNYSKPEFEADKAAGVFAVNMDRVPILHVDGVQIGQSKTIERFIAGRFGFLGSNDVEAALIDMVNEHVIDIKKSYNDSKIGKTGAELEDAKANWITNSIPTWTAKLEKALGNHGFAVGTKISLADVAIFALFEYFDDKAGALAAAAASPKVVGSYELVNTAAAGWLAARPDTKF